MSYSKEYYEAHKDKFKEHNQKYYVENRDKMRKYSSEYYQEHKSEIYESQKKYIAKNRQYVTHPVLKSRKKKSDRLKEEGQMFTFLTNAQRETKMIQHAMRKFNIDEVTAKELLMHHNWNIKFLKEDKEYTHLYIEKVLLKERL